MVNFGGVSGEQLRQLVERIEKLETERRETGELITDCYREAKSQGFDVKALKEIIKQRRIRSDKLAELEEIMDLYKHALGMIPQTESE